MLDLFAYHDNKCKWGYMLLCNNCKDKAPSHVDVSSPLGHVPGLGKEMNCEICKKKGIVRE